MSLFAQFGLLFLPADLFLALGLFLEADLLEALSLCVKLADGLKVRVSLQAAVIMAGLDLAIVQAITVLAAFFLLCLSVFL